MARQVGREVDRGVTTEMPAVSMWQIMVLRVALAATMITRLNCNKSNSNNKDSCPRPRNFLFFPFPYLVPTATLSVS